MISPSDGCIIANHSVEIRMKIYSAYIYDSLLPVFIYSKVVGLCPFNIARDGYSKSLAAIVFPIIVTILFTTHSLSELYIRPIENELYIYILMDQFHTYAGVLCTFVIYLLTIIFRGKVSLIIQHIIISLSVFVRASYPRLTFWEKVGFLR